MKLVVLGGAAAGGNAGSGCSGYLILTGSNAVVVDLGPGTLPELKRHIDVRRISAIVITHMHLDHTLDLVTLRGALKYSPIPVERPIPLYLPPGDRAVLDSMATALDIDDHSPLFFDQTFNVEEYNPLDNLRIGDVSIDFARTTHFLPTWAMRIGQSPRDRSIGYTSDTGPSSHLAAFFRGVDILICEATLLTTDQPPELRGHLTAFEAGRLATDCMPQRLILTHTWDEVGVSNLVREAQRAFAGQVELAWPGLQIDIV